MGRGIVFDIKKYAIHDGPGIRTTFFLKGCPLSCWWCHNPESQSSIPEVSFTEKRCIGCGRCAPVCTRGAMTDGPANIDMALCNGCGACSDACPSTSLELTGRSMTPEEVLREAKKDEMFYDQSGGGVTFSGGEPMMQPEFLKSCLRLCESAGYHRAVDTCGFVRTETLLDIAVHTDLFLYDIKHTNPDKHREYMGVDNDLIIRNLKALDETGVAISARLPFIPGINDSPENINVTGELIASCKHIVSVHLLPYHSIGNSKYSKWHMEYRLAEVLPPTENQLHAAKAILEKHGLNVTTGG